MNENGHDLVEQRQRLLVEQVHRQALDQSPKQPASPPLEAQSLEFTQLPEAKPDSPLYHEWNFYRGQVRRLLAEGHEGQFVLIKGEQIIGMWGTRAEAKAVALQKYLMQPCLIQQVRSREPIVRMSARFWGWQS
jgi:hypothetical protein